MENRDSNDKSKEKSAESDSLTQIGIPAMVALTKQLRSEDPALRDAAAQALTTITGASDYQFLAHLKDPNPEIRAASVRILGEIGGESDQENISMPVRRIFAPISLFFTLRLGAALCCILPAVHADTPGPAVVKVENRGLLFTDNAAGVSGTDAGYSFAMGKQSLWLFGDVFLLEPNAPSRRYVGGVSNCALVVPRGEGTEPLRHYTFLTDPKTGLARQTLPNLKGEGADIRLWPFGGWYDAGAKRAYLYYARIKNTGGGGPFAFRQEGLGLSSADATDTATLEFHRIKNADGKELWWTGEEGAPYFGSAVVANAPGDYLYLVGIQEREKRKIGKLARVRKADITDSSAYEVYAGSTPAGPRWERDLKQAADVEGLADFPSELSVAYNPYLGGYLAVYSVGLSEKLRLSLAPNPWGPYRSIGEIGAPHQAFAQAFCYAGKEHPELEEEHGRILTLTYVDNQRYWLQCLRVTLQK